MTSKRSTNGRGLFYTRDSAGQHEMTPTQYVQWAERKAKELGVAFSPTPDVIMKMIKSNESVHGDLFLDYGVSGNHLSRPGFDKLREVALSDPTVTHIFIPRRDRFARPDNALDALQIENTLRQSGVTLVYMDRELLAVPKGQRLTIEEMLVGMIDFDRAGKDRRDLAQKIIHAQLALAKMGYSTGGRPPYGFQRWLVREDGTALRSLQDGERVRMRGHHVVWLPGDDHKLVVIRRILDLLTKLPAVRVAKLLTAEGVPTPDHGRMRTDNGIKHATSGVWHSTTVTNIARNKLLVAMATHGRRSMGDQLRVSATGPRPLNDEDFRPDGKPKVVSNPEESRTCAAAHFDPIIPVADHENLLAILDQRGGTQRNKPRSRDPNRNPLGGRIFDIKCGWPMYRVPKGKSFGYTCGAYMQSHGSCCAHNKIDGPFITALTIAAIRQKLLSPSAQEMLRAKLNELAFQEQSRNVSPTVLADLEGALAQVQGDLKKAQTNLTFADTKDQYKAIAAVFEELKAKQACLEQDLERERRTAAAPSDAEADVAAALAIFDRLLGLVQDSDDLASVTAAIATVNARVFLGFDSVQLMKRRVNQARCGAITFGVEPPPVELYRGPTGRRALQQNKAATDVADAEGTKNPPRPM